MPIHEYEREDGKIVEMFFPTVGSVLDEIVCDDGVKAKKVMSVATFSFKGPSDHAPSQTLRRKREGLKRNEEAGNRGREKWRERMPKLVK